MVFDWGAIMDFATESAPAVVPFDRAAYMKQYEKNRAPRVRGKRPESNRARYLARKFIAVDGEGLNVKGGNHLYVMLAITDKKPLINVQGIPTLDALDYLFYNLSPDNINVIFGGSYDFNNWVRDLMRHELELLHRSTYGSRPVWVGPYQIQWIKGKEFIIKKDKKRVVINDVISFFQCSFIAACDSYLGENYEGRDELVREKARRGNFKAEELATIDHYNQLELRLLVRLMEELRARLDRAGLRPLRWNSPGAIAAALFKREGVKEHKGTVPDAVAKAARFAYAGGRFEIIKYGSVDAPAYEYDINSAYPRAMVNVPSLKMGTWKHHSATKERYPVWPFALYKVRYEMENRDNWRLPQPIFVRGAKGNVGFPPIAENWIWSPEYESLLSYVDTIPGARLSLLEAWEYKPATNIRPFKYVTELYEKRQALKALGDGAHVGIKLGLNSGYGKLAQQVGWRAATDKYPLRLPPYHQLEWAGYITSWCRAHALKAVIPQLDKVIAFETDAVFTTEPLKNVTVGEGLGEWEFIKFNALTYVQSGFYFGKTKKGIVTSKTRGADRGQITKRRVENALKVPIMDRYLPFTLTRFYGLGVALAQDFSKWCKWVKVEKLFALFPDSKRVLMCGKGCPCGSVGPLVRNMWHETAPAQIAAGGISHEYPVAWINPDPEMDALEENRENEFDLMEDYA